MIKELIEKIKGDILAVGLIVTGILIVLKTAERDLGKSLVASGLTHLGTK